MADSLIQVLEGLDACDCEGPSQVGAYEEVCVSGPPTMPRVVAGSMTVRSADARRFGLEGLGDELPTWAKIGAAIVGGIGLIGGLTYLKLRRVRKTVRRSSGLEGTRRRRRR